MAKLSFPTAFFFFLLMLQASFYLSSAQSYIGVNYGQVADNLPAPAATAKLLQSTTIQNVRLYGSDPVVIKAFANTGIGIVIGVSNGDIPNLASDPSAAKGWVGANVAAYYPASNIIMITVGNEVYYSGDQNLMTHLAPAMQNLQSALSDAGLAGKVRLATVNAMTVLQQSDPPSAGRFDPAMSDLLTAQLQVLNATGSPFAINPYPYFAYQSDPRPDTLAFCLFQPNAGRVDSGNSIKYTNMFDAQVDAVRSALDAMGFKGVDILVAETGWPYKGDTNEVGPSVDNAKAYVGNLVSHLRSKSGTPLMPGKPVETYLFALYDEDLKPGPTSERSFGLFKPDLTMTYDAGLSKSTVEAPSMTPTESPVTPTVSPPTPPTTSPSPSSTLSNSTIGTACTPSQQGGSCNGSKKKVASSSAFGTMPSYKSVILMLSLMCAVFMI
ncbi:hypothetical protein V2J09_011707 [Rumex salicifolius]